MPFLRFSRDTRGYEHFYLVQPAGRRGKTRPRVLYWLRTPPNVKVGRQPFDDHIRRALEAQNPGVAFDWTKLLATPIPPPGNERWRERRRAERAARQGAKAEAGGRDDSDVEATTATESEPFVPPTDVAPPGDAAPAGPMEPSSSRGALAVAADGTADLRRDGPAPPGRRRRRRRRGGRRNHQVKPEGE